MSSRSVTLAELRKNLSACIGSVRDGDELVVRDGDAPIAKIIPFPLANLPAEQAALVAEGKLRLGQGELPASFWRKRAPRVSAADVVRAIRADRDED